MKLPMSTPSKKRIAVISNYPNGIHDNPDQFFHYVIDLFQDSIDWEYISYDELFHEEIFTRALSFDGLLISSSEFFLADPLVQEKMAVEVKLIQEFQNPIFGMCFGSHVMKLAFGLDVSKDLSQFGGDDHQIIDLITAPQDQNPHPEPTGMGESEFVTMFDDQCSFGTPPLPCPVIMMQHKTRPIFGIDFQMSSNDPQKARQAATITLQKFLRHFFF
ncbi:MAG: glutamine amidotransferase-related protein [Promethearchaeota archaeon]